MARNRYVDETLEKGRSPQQHWFLLLLRNRAVRLDLAAGYRIDCLELIETG